MSERVYLTEDGEKFNEDELVSKTKCDFCGDLASVEFDGEYEFPDNHYSLHEPHGSDGDIREVCGECLSNGINVEPTKS